MGQCKSKDQDFKSYVNARTWDSASLRRETLKNRKKERP
jgi:hypothetical protein